MNLLMALAAGIQPLLLEVTVVTFKAVWYVAMTLVVTGLTPLLAVGTGERLEFSGRAGMAVRANLGQAIVSRKFAWRMRVLVAVAAVRLAGAMSQPVASAADGHQCVVIVLARAVGVKNLMTLLAGKTVFAASLLKISKLRGMTLAAFHRLEWFGSCCIKLRINLRKCPRRFGSRPWPGEEPGQGDGKQQADCDILYKLEHDAPCCRNSLFFLFGLLGWPVIQIMRNVVTFATFREARVHALCMRQTVAVGTLWHSLVLVGVAGNTRDLTMLRLAGSQGLKYPAVTGSTKV